MQLFWMVAVVYFLAIISPGPDFMMVTRNALLYSRNIALFTALGISAGVAIHLSYCILGLAFLTDNRTVIFNIIKYIGGFYLIYTGLKGLLSKNEGYNTKIVKDGSNLSSLSAFGNGLFCNLFNPKACLFLLSLFTLISKEQISLQFKVLYGAGMVSVTLLWFGLLTVLFTIPSINQQLLRIQRPLLKLLSLFLVILGFYLLNMAL